MQGENTHLALRAATRIRSTVLAACTAGASGSEQRSRHLGQCLDPWDLSLLEQCLHCGPDARRGAAKWESFLLATLREAVRGDWGGINVWCGG